MTTFLLLQNLWNILGYPVILFTQRTKVIDIEYNSQNPTEHNPNSQTILKINPKVYPGI